MRQWPYFLLACVLITTGGFCAVIQQEDFTSGENGTLPSTLDAAWDAGTDVFVTDLATVGVPSDHTGGDGYVLHLGDGILGGWNLCYPANYQTVSYADSAVEAWEYFDFEGISYGRNYGLMIRSIPDPGGNPALITGYMLCFSVNSSYMFRGNNPPDYRAGIIKRTGPQTFVLLSVGTTDYTTGWHKLRIEDVGSEIKGYIDGNLEVSATDTDYASGFAGMVYYDANGVDEGCAFDNFLWETYPPVAGVKSWTLYDYE